MNNNDEPIFDRKEIQRILRIATELEQKDKLLTDDDNLSLGELEKVARDAGIKLKYIHSAIEQLKEREEEKPGFLSNQSFTYRKTILIDGNITEDNWDDVVTEIRRANGGIGKTGRLGNSWEWEQRQDSVGYLQVSLTPKKDKTRIRINSSYRMFAILSQFFGVMGGIVIMALIGKFFPNYESLKFLFLLIGGITGFGVGRIYAIQWMKAKRNKLATLANRLVRFIRDELNANRPGVEKSSEGSKSGKNLNREGYPDVYIPHEDERVSDIPSRPDKSRRGRSSS